MRPHRDEALAERRRALLESVREQMAKIETPAGALLHCRMSPEDVRALEDEHASRTGTHGAVDTVLGLVVDLDFSLTVGTVVVEPYRGY